MNEIARNENKQVFISRKQIYAWNAFISAWIYIQCFHYISKKKEAIQKFKETGDLWYIYQNELDKACFQHEMAY